MWVRSFWGAHSWSRAISWKGCGVGALFWFPYRPPVHHRPSIEAGPNAPVASHCQKETKQNSFLLRHCSVHPTFQQLLGRQLGNQVCSHTSKDKTDYRLLCFCG